MFPVDNSQSHSGDMDLPSLLPDDVEWTSWMFPPDPQEIAEKQSRLALYILGAPLDELHSRYQDPFFQNDIKELVTSDIAEKNPALVSKIKSITNRIVEAPLVSIENQLFDACKRHDCQAVCAIVEKLEPRQNFRNREGKTALHAFLAAGQFHPETVQALIHYNPSWLEARDCSGKFAHEYVQANDAIQIARLAFPNDSFRQVAYLLKAQDSKYAAEYFKVVDPSVWTVPNSQASWDGMKLVLACAWETGKKGECEQFLELFYQKNPTLAVLSLASEIDVELVKPFMPTWLASPYACQWPDSVDRSACASWKHRPVLQGNDALQTRLDEMRLVLSKFPESIAHVGDLQPWVKALFLDEDQELPVLSRQLIDKNRWLTAFLRSETFPVKKLSIDSESVKMLYEYLTLFNEQAARYIVEQTNPPAVFYPFRALLDAFAISSDDHAHNCKIFEIVLQNKALQCWNTQDCRACIRDDSFINLWFWIFEHHPVFKMDPGLVSRFLREVLEDQSRRDLYTKQAESFVRKFITHYPKAIEKVNLNCISEELQLFFLPYILKYSLKVSFHLQQLGYRVLQKALLQREDIGSEKWAWKQLVQDYALLDLMGHVQDAYEFIRFLSQKIDLTGIVQDGHLDGYRKKKSTFRPNVFGLLFSLRGGIHFCAESYSTKSTIGKAFGPLASTDEIQEYIRSKPAIPGWKVRCYRDLRSLSLTLAVQIDEGRAYEIFKGYATSSALIKFIDEYEKQYSKWLQAANWASHIPPNFLVQFHSLDEKSKVITFRKTSFVNNRSELKTLAFGTDFQDADTLRRLVGIEEFYENERRLLSQHFPGIPIVIGSEPEPSEPGVCYIHINDTFRFHTGSIIVDVKTMDELVRQVFNFYLQTEHRMPGLSLAQTPTLRDMYFAARSLLRLIQAKGTFFEYPQGVAGGATLVMLREPSPSVQLIASSTRMHHEFNELMQLHTAKNGLVLDAVACNAYTRQANDAMKDLHVIPERAAPIDLKVLLEHFTTQKNSIAFVSALRGHKLSPEIAYQNLDHFVRCVIEKKGIRGWDPVKYRKEYEELEIYLTHAVQEFLRKKDTGNINALVVEMCTCHTEMCSNRRSDIVRSCYNLAFNISSRPLIKDVKSCESIDDILLLGYTQAFLETIDTMTKMVLDRQAIAQSTHVNSCIRKLLKKELTLDAPADPRLSLYQNEVGRDLYSATGSEEFPDGSVRFFFPALFSIEYIRKLRNIQDELIKEKKWPLLGVLKQVLIDALEECLKGERPPCMQAKNDYMKQVAIHAQKVEEAKLKFEKSKQVLQQSQTVEVVREYKAHKNQLAVLDMAVQATARGLLEKAKEHRLLEERERAEKALPKITLPCPDADGGPTDDLKRELQLLEKSQEQQKKEIESIVQIGRELFQSNLAVLKYEKAVQEHAACESEYNAVCENRSGIIRVLEELLEREHLSDPQDELESLTLRAWVYILRFRGILQPEAPRSLSAASTPGGR